MSTGPDIPDAQQSWRRIRLFCVLAFALAGATALVLQATGGIAGSRPLVPGTPITLAVVLLPTAYMFSPAVAHVLTRVLTREGWRGLGLVPHFGPSQRRLWLLAWLLPPALTLLSALLYFAVFPESFDPALTAARGPLGGPTAGQEAPGGGAPTTVLALQVGIALTIAPFVNSILAFGEEFGWRGYLLPRLVALVGRRPALVVTGIVWGVWHWPLILMGYEYGLDYPGAPWLGLALFCIFTVAAGVLLGWLALSSGSVWPAALGHGSINATGAVALLVTTSPPNLIVGPAGIGALGLVPWVLAAFLLILERSRDDQSVDTSVPPR